MTSIFRFRQLGAEVYGAEEGIVTFGGEDIVGLKGLAATTPRQRARICAHGDTNSPLHEMLIVHPKNAYVRPHKHVGKAESLLVVEGEVRFIVFDHQGCPAKAFEMAAGSADRPFFIRIPEDTFHTLLIASEWLTFLEVTTGPFKPEATIFAPWAPSADDVAAVQSYHRNLLEQTRAL